MTVLVDGREINRAIEEAEDVQKVRRHPVVEIFGPTIQGEGAMLGERTMFIRFGGCDYRCTKCDSLHAVLPDLVKKNSVRMTAEEIMTHLRTAPKSAEWVTLSGGNPVMHDLDDLVDALKAAGHKIAVETQGSLWRDWLLKCDHVTVSPKGPGMGEKFDEEDFNYYVTRLGTHTFRNVNGGDWSVKVVIMSAQDMEFAKELLTRWGQIHKRFYLSLGNPFPPQPKEEGGLDKQDIRQPLLDHYNTLVEDILQDPFFDGCKVTPQLHVLFWGNKQGV